MDKNTIPRVRGIEQSIFDRYVNLGLKSIVDKQSSTFGVVELDGVWDYDTIASIDGPVVIRQCQNFFNYKQPFGLREAEEIFSVVFLFFI